MSTNRAALLTKAFKVLKKHYKPVAPPADRPTLEHLMYACCLENSEHQAADDVLAKLETLFFDWNEVRVTTASELSEVMESLNDPSDAARRLKRTLHSVFETHYTFDIDFLKKMNLGKAIKEFERFNGMTPFVLSYVTQTALSGHSIPVNATGFDIMTVLGVITEAEAKKGRVPGLERTIAKNKGIEFGSLFHQLAVDYATSPHSTRVRSIITEIAPDAKDRLPKRSTKKPAAAASKTETKKAGKKKETKKKATAKAAPKKKAKPAAAAKPKKKTKKTSKSTTKRLARKKPR